MARIERLDLEGGSITIYSQPTTPQEGRNTFEFFFVLQKNSRLVMSLKHFPYFCTAMESAVSLWESIQTTTTTPVHHEFV